MNGDLKSKVGQKSSRKTFEVTEARLRQFCDAVSAKYRGEAPPTFFTILRQGEFELWRDLGIELSKVLHADQEYFYDEPVRPGDHLEYETVMTKAIEKQSRLGATRFMVFDTEFFVRRPAGLFRVGTAKTTVIVKEEAQSA